MPQQKSSSEILKKLGSRLGQAVVKTAGNELKPRSNGLPAGVRGVAKLVKVWVGEYESGPNQGKPYFSMQASVIEPEEYKGEFTFKQNLTLAETKTKAGKVTTFEEAVNRVIDELKYLGANEEDFTDDPMCLLNIGQILVDSKKCFFKFNTSEGKEQINPATKKPYPPTIFHNWNGRIKDYVQEMTDPIQVEASTAGRALQSHQNHTTASSTPAPIRPTQQPGKTTTQAQPKLNGTPSTTAAKSPPTKEPELAFTEFGDLDSLAQQAMDGDEEAGAELTRLAKEAGLEQEAADAPDWAAVGDLLRGIGGSPEPEPEEEATEEPEEFVPVVGNVYHYTPKDKQGRPGKPVEAEVMVVQEAARKVTIKNLSTGKPASVSWDSLSVID